MPDQSPAEVRFPPRIFSGWSIASVCLLGLAIAAATFTLSFVVPDRGTGPAEGAAVALVVGVGGITAWTCALLGTIFGWLGLGRCTRAKALAVVIALLNTILTCSPFVAPIVWQIIVTHQDRG